MSLSRIIHGQSTVTVAKLDTTATTAILTGAASHKTLVNTVRLVARTGTPSVTVEIYHARQAFPILHAVQALTAGEPFDLDMHGLSLLAGDELRVTASAANEVEVTAWTVQPSETGSRSI